MNTLTRLDLCLATLTAAILLAFALLGTPAHGQTSGTLPTIRNFHAMDAQGLIYRGSQPGKKTRELKTFGIQSVLMIKKQNANELDLEVEQLRDLGLRSQIIPLGWDHPDVKQLCYQIVEAVQVLQAQKRAGTKTFFHCTAGEDRTGTVAGLFRMVDQGWSANRAFKDEMCAHGYSDGAPGKPANVVAGIESSLTPVFLALSKSVSNQSLNPSACERITIPAVVPTCRKL